MSKKVVAKIITFGLPVIIGEAITLSSKNGDLAWLGFLIGIITMSIISEAFKRWTGQTIIWECLTPRDKLIFTICTIVFCTFALYPLKEDMSPGVIFVSGLIGYVIYWSVIYKFGSDEMKARLLWPKPK